MRDRVVDSGVEQRHYERRQADQRMSIIAESPLLRILVYIITSIGIPMIAWGLNNIVTEIRAIHESINAQNIVLNAHELRISSLEKVKIGRDIEMKAANDKIIEHDLRLKFLEERRK